MEKANNFLDNWVILVGLCLTLGLVPFFPEPHIWGKLKWVRGGAVGMGIIDWLDLLMHGIPWVLLLRWIGRKVEGKV